jgi:tetratricopeptide (TPR) repeat protein
MSRLRARRFEQAAALFARAAAHDPTNAGYATDLGFALGRLGRHAEAEAVLRGAIEREPRRVYAWVNLAEIYAEDPTRWDRREAIVAFLEKGFEALKENRKGRFNLILGMANFERAVGRTAAARARLQPLLAVDAAPPLSRPQRKRVLDLLDAIALDDRAHALEDWPRPPIQPGDAQEAEAAARALEASRYDEARDRADTLVRRYPSWSRALLLRARAFEATGRVDEAARDLKIAVNLAPSDGEAWRALGKILAQHGGALEAESADEALRNALTLEPGWADLRQLRDKLARRRAAAGRAPAVTGGSAAPSDLARSLYQQAEEWIQVGDPVGLGRELLEQALADSPAFVAAAVSAYALTGTVPPATPEALKDDGPGLWALASGVRKLGKTDKATAPAVDRGLPGSPGKSAPIRRPEAGDGVEALVRPWIDRAVALDVQEARFARAIARAGAGERAGALSDLVAYVAREPNPEHLAEARALRAGLDDHVGTRGDAQRSPQLLARIRLLEDRPDAALSALGGKCTRDVPSERLVAMGLVNEYADRRSAARTCYELAAATTGGQFGALGLERLAHLDARLPDPELRVADRRLLEAGAAAGIGAAEWALARLAEADGNRQAALTRTERALTMAVGRTREGASWVDAARATKQRLSDALRSDADARQHRHRRISYVSIAAAAMFIAMLARRRWRGRTVAGALRRRPGLFPEVARAVGELRHDVLKHRAGVLSLLGDSNVDVDEIVRALTEPRPTSVVVAAIYDRLAQAARGQGIVLRALAREPLFGAIHRDLARAEALLAPMPSLSELGAIDARLRGAHADGLAALLELGPRTRLDAAALSTWIGSVEATTRRAGGGWTAPSLSLADLAVDFPVEEDAMAGIFANLLRNAQAAVAGQTGARVVVRVDRARDVTGRQQVSLLVGDSATTTLTLETIEARESGRGLAIVRDLVREWRGHLVVRPDAFPFTKVVGACFPS